MRRQPGRLVFIDETSIKTNMTPLRGRSLKGERLMADAPFGKWRTQTFIAGLRCHKLVAPWIVEGAMDGPTFDSYVRTQLAPCLRRGDVVIPATNFVRADNLNVHKSPRAAQTLAERGAWFLFLPKYFPDLNPIEQAFAKLKTLLRKAKGWQDAGAVMIRHLRVSAVHLRIVAAGLDHRDLGVVWDQEFGHAANRRERVHMRRDPVRQALRPGRLGIGKARRAQHRDKVRRLARRRHYLHCRQPPNWAGAFHRGPGLDQYPSTEKFSSESSGATALSARIDARNWWATSVVRSRRGIC
jgi:transposase